MQVEFLKISKDIQIPAYATVGSAGFDLVADNFQKYYEGETEIDIKNIVTEPGVAIMNPHSRLLVGCGFGIALPEGYVLDIRPRGGNALKRGLSIANTPGTVDCDFRGEVCIILLNTTNRLLRIKLGEKLAQGVVIAYEVIVFKVVDKLSNTVRGSGAYGHTG